MGGDAIATAWGAASIVCSPSMIKPASTSAMAAARRSACAAFAPDRHLARRLPVQRLSLRLQAQRPHGAGGGREAEGAEERLRASVEPRRLRPQAHLVDLLARRHVDDRVRLGTGGPVTATPRNRLPTATAERGSAVGGGLVRAGGQQDGAGQQQCSRSHRVPPGSGPVKWAGASLDLWLGGRESTRKFPKRGAAAWARGPWYKVPRVRRLVLM